MDGIKIEVTGNIARVIKRPARITAGTVGLPVEFAFDSQWDGLSKTAVFRAGHVSKIVDNIVEATTVPWEVLKKGNIWLSIGVYGVNADGSVAIPTIWANVCVIQIGVSPDGDPGTAPTLPVWQKLLNAIGNLAGLKTKAKDNLVDAVNEVHDIAVAGGAVPDKNLSVSGTPADAKATGDTIRSISVTPQMFGAVADGLADDTAAVRAAIDSGSAVYFPKGTYLITDTITINGGVRLYGAGIAVATIKYTGSGYLFHIKAEYKNYPIIEKMNFVGGTDNSFIKCISDEGNWGGCFTLRDFHVQYFNVEWLRLISAFKVLVENGSFKTLGKCVMTTYDEMPTDTNFNNCITFRNCLISCPKYGKGDIPVMFEMFNVQQLLFEKCALERCETMFKDFVTETWKNSENFNADKNLNRDLVLSECWLEGVGNMYDFTYDSSIPVANNCKYVSVSQHNANLSENEPDFLKGYSQMNFRNGETSSIEAAIWGTEKVVQRTTILNEDDTSGEYFFPHKMSTKEVLFNVPFNADVVQVHGKTTVKKQLKLITRYSSVCCRFVQTIIFVYAEIGATKSTNVWQCEWLSFDGSYYMVKKPERIYEYGSGTAATATETVERTASGELTATTDQEPLTLAIVTEYNFNGARRLQK